MRQARCEITRPQCKLLKESVSILVADEVLSIQRKKRVDQELRNASHTPQRIVNIARLPESAAELQAELGAPQAVLDNPVSQAFGVLRHRLLEPNDFAIRVMEWNTDKRLSEVDDTAEAVRRLLVVVVVPYPLPALLR